VAVPASFCGRDDIAANAPEPNMKPQPMPEKIKQIQYKTKSYYL
jgi:hypothetical protein